MANVEKKRIMPAVIPLPQSAAVDDPFLRDLWTVSCWYVLAPDGQLLDSAAAIDWAIAFANRDEANQMEIDLLVRKYSGEDKPKYRFQVRNSELHYSGLASLPGSEPPNDADLARARDSAVTDLEYCLKKTRQILLAATEGADTLYATLREELSYSDLGVHIAPDLTAKHPSGKKKYSRVVWRIDGADSPDKVALYAGLLLLDSAVRGKTSVGQCRWNKCGRFFRVRTKGKGKPAREYCPGSDHREKSRPKSTERSRRRRERIRREKAEQQDKRSVAKNRR